MRYFHRTSASPEAVLDVAKTSSRFAVGQIDHRRVDAADAFERLLDLSLAMTTGHTGDTQFDVRHGSSPSTIIYVHGSPSDAADGCDPRGSSAIERAAARDLLLPPAHPHARGAPGRALPAEQGDWGPGSFARPGGGIGRFGLRTGARPEQVHSVTPDPQPRF